MMTSNIGGPLFMLRWKGGICPCFEKPEDKGARLALESLSGLPVKWFRTGRDAKSLGGMMSGWFGGSSNSGGGSNKSDKDAVDAVLEWVDAEKGPELLIKPSQQSSSTPSGADGEISLQKQSAGYIKTIKLQQLDKVLIQEAVYIVLQSEKETGKPQDLVTLESVIGDANEIKEALTQLIEWDARRLAEIPEEDRELEEVGIKAKAQKAAHFAKREIELQKQKREREKRKAELVKESGGLKYTAIAMANRMDD
mmetsp:Transcript_17165/g.28516  ORF Transcript_17165/g.28516 Transcript_17165/m.28516 type:complete len:253 (-) Transcript_17165:939-1697(-)